MTKTKTYIPPQGYAETIDCSFGLCQASGGEFNEPTDVDDIVWND